MPTEPTSQRASRTDPFARRWWYHVFLGTLVSIHVLAPIGLETGHGQGVLRFSWVAVLVLGVVFARRKTVELAIAAMLLLVSTGTGFAAEASPVHAVSATARLVFLLVISALILRELAGHPVVTLSTLSGAFVVYLLLALAFVECYDLVDTVTDYAALDGVQAADEVETEDESLARRLDLTYFSLVTMTTLGYGDITPSDQLTRSLATLQALLGQTYIAVLIARLVSLYRPPRSTAP
jgi:hypothetical protein